MKILYWTTRIIGMILLSPVVIVAIPGSIFYFVSEELETYVDFKNLKDK
jgi:hypothetical protein